MKLVLNVWALVLAGSLVGGPARAADDRPSPHPGSRTLDIGAGKIGGGFHRLTLGLDAASHRLSEGTVRLSPLNVGGSCGNIRRLLATAALATPEVRAMWGPMSGQIAHLLSELEIREYSELWLALVQHDVAYEAFQAGAGGGSLDTSDLSGSGWMCGVPPWVSRMVDLRLVAALQSEAVHLLVRRPVHIEDLGNLRSHEVYLGRVGSGSYETSKAMLGAAGYDIGEFDRYPCGSDEARCALAEWSGAGCEERWRRLNSESNEQADRCRGKRLLAAILSVVPGDQYVRSLVASGLVTVIPLSSEVIDVVRHRHPYYEVCKIASGTYWQQQADIPSVCLSTVLVAAAPRGAAVGVADETLETVLDAALELEASGAAWLRGATDPTHAIGPVHVEFWRFAESTLPLHRLSRLRRDRALSVRGFVAGVVLLLLVLAYLRRNQLSRLVSGWRSRMRRGGARTTRGVDSLILPVAVFLGVTALAALGTFLLEHRENVRMHSPWEAFWAMAAFSTGNFEASELKTTGGRALGVMTTLAGLATLAWFTATLTSRFTSRRAWAPPWQRGHVVVVNFRESMLPLVELLRREGPIKPPKLHIIPTEDVPERVRNYLRRLPGVRLHEVHPEYPDELGDAAIAQARRILILRRTEGTGAPEPEPDADSSVDERRQAEWHDQPLGRQGFHSLRVVRAVENLCPPASQPNREGNGIDLPVPESSIVAALRRRLHVGLSGVGVRPGSVWHDSAALGRPWTVVETDTPTTAEYFRANYPWVVPVQHRAEVDRCIALSCVYPDFPRLFFGMLDFAPGNAEVYSTSVPREWESASWRELRRAVATSAVGGEVISLGIHRTEPPLFCPGRNQDEDTFICSAAYSDLLSDGWAAASTTGRRLLAFRLLPGDLLTEAELMAQPKSERKGEASDGHRRLSLSESEQLSEMVSMGQVLATRSQWRTLRTNRGVPQKRLCLSVLAKDWLFGGEAAIEASRQTAHRSGIVTAFQTARRIGPELLAALRSDAARGEVVLNPPPDHRLQAGDRLIALADTEALLRAAVQGLPSQPRSGGE